MVGCPRHGHVGIRPVVLAEGGIQVPGEVTLVLNLRGNLRVLVARDFGNARRLHRRVLFQGSIGEFGVDDVELPNGSRTELAVLRHPGAAAVVAFTAPDEVLMLRQYRYAAGGTLWEVPAGKLDPGESPESCALRELEEETGYVALSIYQLGTIFTTPGFTDEVIHLFAASDLSPGTVNLDPHETLSVERMPLSRALAMVASGEIRDAKSICALFLAHGDQAS
jgi:ADP-ribose pyrophosphatase